MKREVKRGGDARTGSFLLLRRWAFWDRCVRVESYGDIFVSDNSLESELNGMMDAGEMFGIEG